MTPPARRQLTPREAIIFAIISHYTEYIGEPAPPSYIARAAKIARPSVYGYLASLYGKGWLRGRTLAMPVARGPIAHP
jgi:hypothetical protein